MNNPPRLQNPNRLSSVPMPQLVLGADYFSIGSTRGSAEKFILNRYRPYLFLFAFALDIFHSKYIFFKGFIGAHLGLSEKFGTKRVIGSAFFYRVKSVRVVGATR